MSEIFVIGIDHSGFDEEQQRLLRRCTAVFSSRRLAIHAEDIALDINPITPLKEAISNMEQALSTGDVGVLASGDPLFYGIGATLIERFGRDRVQVLPALSSLQAAFARFKLSWSDCEIVSLHGRRHAHLPTLLLRQPKTFVFTDKDNSPNVLAQTLLDYLGSIDDQRIRQQCLVHVAEDLGSDNENITVGTLTEIAGMSFSPLNVVCLVLPQLTPRPVFGLREDEIAHSRGLITKDEIRAATLHRLRLPRQGVFWDIGGGSGAVSAEAAAIHSALTVYTVERKEEQLENIKENIRRFSLFNMVPVAGNAAAHLEKLPDPDGVFIGGSGGELEEIIAHTATRLKSGSRLVINGVTEKTVANAPLFMQRHGLEVETTRLTVSRSGPDGPLNLNPITIMVGTK